MIGYITFSPKNRSPLGCIYNGPTLQRADITTGLKVYTFLLPGMNGPTKIVTTDRQCNGPTRRVIFSVIFCHIYIRPTYITFHEVATGRQFNGPTQLHFTVFLNNWPTHYITPWGFATGRHRNFSTHAILQGTDKIIYHLRLFKGPTTQFFHTVLQGTDNIIIYLCCNGPTMQFFLAVLQGTDKIIIYVCCNGPTVHRADITTFSTILQGMLSTINYHLRLLQRANNAGGGNAPPPLSIQGSEINFAKVFRIYFISPFSYSIWLNYLNSMHAYKKSSCIIFGDENDFFF